MKAIRQFVARMERSGPICPEQIGTARSAGPKGEARDGRAIRGLKPSVSPDSGFASIRATNYQRLMSRLRDAIENGNFVEVARELREVA